MESFAAKAGCRITEVDGRHAVAEMTVSAMHLNGGNVCQGGALFTLADLAIAAWMNNSGQLTFGINSSIMFVSSAHEGDVLRAEAVGICNHHKIPAVEVRVTDQDGRLICHVTGMGYRKNVNVPTELLESR
jgi:acyl-CoA thioesterase